MMLTTLRFISSAGVFLLWIRRMLALAATILLYHIARTVQEVAVLSIIVGLLHNVVLLWLQDAVTDASMAGAQNNNDTSTTLLRIQE
jgi:hypothetical protein